MRSADFAPARSVMSLPASLGLIFFSFAVAYVLSVLPWTGGWLLARPDFMLLVLLFWSLHEPRVIGQGMAFALGLLMDVSDSMLLGQHAFAYVVGVFGVQVLRNRILTFSLPEQSLHILGITFATSGVMLLLNLLLGADFPGAAFFISPALTGMLWAPLNWVLYLPSMRRRRGEGAP